MKNVKQTRTSYPKKLCLATYTALLAGNPVRLINAEEASIMTGANVPTAMVYSTPDGNILINGSYKSYIGTESNTSPVDAAVDLP